MTNATDAEIIAYAVALLDTGLLPSTLPLRLVAEFGIPLERARRLAVAAINRWAKDQIRAVGRSE